MQPHPAEDKHSSREVTTNPDLVLTSLSSCFLFVFSYTYDVRVRSESVVCQLSVGWVRGREGRSTSFVFGAASDPVVGTRPCWVSCCWTLNCGSLFGSVNPDAECAPGYTLEAAWLGSRVWEYST